jgi:hypothetical protein
MALKFLYLVNDPFVNQSEEFVRILNVFALSGPGAELGELVDPLGNTVCFTTIGLTTQATESTAYPYTYSLEYQIGLIMIIPPGWTYKSFSKAIAVQGSIDEVLRVH